MGTPKNLHQAIENGKVKNDTFAHIKDYLAQKFCIAVMRAKSEEERERLFELLKMVTQEDEQ